MGDTKVLLCLANSRKNNGRCIAGREVVDGVPGRWIRPVSDREHQEVSEYERQYEDGSDPQVLDLIAVPVLEPRASDYQSENWLLDPRFYWAREGRATVADLDRFAEMDGSLWTNGYGTYSGYNDRIPVQVTSGLDRSLRLIHVDALVLRVEAPGAAFGNPKRQVQARFHLHGVLYALRVTDPTIERSYLARPNSDYELGESYLTVSLGEPYHDYVYKLVAAVVEVDPNGSR